MRASPELAKASRGTDVGRLFLALLLILIGVGLAWGVQTSGGSIEVQDVRWLGTDGTRMSGLLYVPPGANPQNPAPATRQWRAGRVCREEHQRKGERTEGDVPVPGRLRCISVRTGQPQHRTSEHGAEHPARQGAPGQGAADRPPPGGMTPRTTPSPARRNPRTPSEYLSTARHKRKTC